MTVATEVSRNDYVGTGAVATFDYDFKIYDETDLLVTKLLVATGVETELSYPTDYSVTGVGEESGGTFTLTAGNLASGYNLTARFHTTLTSETDLRNQGAYHPETVEDAIDRGVKIDQQQQDEIDRALKLPETSGASPLLPSPQGGFAIAWNALGNGFINVALATGTSLASLIASGGSALVGFIQSGVGAVLRTVQDKLREQVTPEDFGAEGDGVTDDTDALQAAITFAQTTGRTLVINAVYGISAQLEITDAIGLEFAPGGKIVALDTFPDPVSLQDAGWLLHVDGANCAGSRFSNPNLDGNDIAGGLGIFNTSNITVRGGTVENMRGPGTFFETGADSIVTAVNYSRCGIDTSGDTGGRTSTLRGDICTNVKFIGNTVRRSGGKAIAFSTSTDCIATKNFAIDCTESHGLPYYMVVCTRCEIEGNVGVQGFEVGAAGVCKVSINSTYCKVANNTFIQYGDKDIVFVEDAPNTSLTGNTFIAMVATATGRQAIRVDTGGGPTSTDLVVKNNDFYGQGAGTAIAYTLITGVFTGNYFKGWQQAIQISAVGGVVHSNTYVECDVGHSFGGSSNYVTDRIHTLFSINNEFATSGAGFFSVGYTLEANTLDRTGGIRVFMAGTKTGGGGNKTISFRFGTTDFTVNAAANDTNDWSFTAYVLNSLVGGVTVTQNVHVVGYNGTTVIQDFGTAVEDTTIALNVAARINVANAADVVSVRMMTVELLK